MRQYDDVNQGLKSLNQKIVLLEKEQTEILSKINQKLNSSVKESTALQWRYYLASALAIVLLAVIALPLMNSDINLVGGNQEGTQGPLINNSATSEEVREEITLNIENQTSFDIYFIKVNLIKDGVLKHTQGGMAADGSPIEPGDKFDFLFYQNELGEGTYEIEIDFSNEPTNNSNQPPEHSSSKVILEISNQKVYTLELKGDSTNFTYIINPSIESSGGQLGSINEVKEQLNLDLSKNEIVTVYGEDYKTVKSSFDGAEIWRYDFGEIGGYTYDVEYDHADVDGMQRGIIQAQLFVKWNKNNNVEAYTVLYLDKEEKIIYFYELLSNGTERERVACGYDEEYGWICPG